MDAMKPRKDHTGHRTAKQKGKSAYAIRITKTES
ncbi:hypothetical protein BAMTA208_12130 [Bacillus amyloliquefaciens TA208]|uniref:Uncharacterized protein n=1 Tax=Bacillus amyloliquefaciens (strain ATCC 23350 / DSM 7 / BCRC 11601 / CCUG 28519 / NBRC 15535 / NRRL B-14393 / F) TaxID=692420 RepID=A0A9P1JID7_BACAS|nr:hypothetical protein BAMTA208_12130 [Bacillus amyloliquefaciens TA208]CBI43392.1 hypothetical protein YqjZ [Bacillus amyloliquefaciens DSM 7] [Bacillus amyloliquefaciens DSM 7 = ATCC 23350]